MFLKDLEEDYIEVGIEQKVKHIQDMQKILIKKKSKQERKLSFEKMEKYCSVIRVIAHTQIGKIRNLGQKKKSTCYGNSS